MPYSSDAQRRYFNANRDKMEKQGVDVDEWNQASKGKELPEHASSAAGAREIFSRRKHGGKSQSKPASKVGASHIFGRKK